MSSKVRDGNSFLALEEFGVLEQIDVLQKGQILDQSLILRETFIFCGDAFLFQWRGPRGFGGSAWEEASAIAARRMAADKSVLSEGGR